MSTPYGPADSDSDPIDSSPAVIPAADPAAAPAADKEYFRPTLPGEPKPNQMIMRPTSRTQAVIRGGLAVLLAVGGVVNLVWGARFPSNAPVEQIFSFLISLDMFAAAIVLGVFAILALARRSVPVRPQSTSPMSVAAVILAGVAFIGWALFNLVPVLINLADGERYQYMNAVAAIVFLGVPWVLGMIFGALSLRSGGRLTPILATIAIALGVVLAIAAVAFAVVYGLGLSD
jgi:hypothetical protein